MAYVDCSTCGGTGTVGEFSMVWDGPCTETCTTCKGTGKRYVPDDEDDDSVKADED